MNKYTIIPIDGNVSIRAGYSVEHERIDILENGKTASGNEIFIVEHPSQYHIPGDLWLHIVEADQKPVNGWVAVVHLGRLYCAINENPIPLPVPDGQRQYYRILYDWEIGKLRNAAPCPAIVNFQQMQHNSLNKEWQEFWFGLNRTGNDILDKKAWGLYANSKAFLTDGTGVDTCRNYIDETDPSLPLPKIESKGCQGNVICAVGDPVMLWKGMWWLQIETLNITKPPPVGMTYQSHPHLIHHATNLAGDGICNPFPHFGGRDTGIPVLFPVTSKGPVFYPQKYLAKLSPGSPIPNPYTPPMEFKTS